MDFIRILKIIRRYNLLRKEELTIRLKMQNKMKDLKLNLGRLSHILPEIKIPKILKKKEVKEEKPAKLNEEKQLKVKEEKELGYKKYLGYLKDAVYIIMIAISMYGWISTKAKNEAVLETTVKQSTEAIQKIQTFVDKQVELNSKQAEFNGRTAEYMNSHK